MNDHESTRKDTNQAAWHILPGDDPHAPPTLDYVRLMLVYLLAARRISQDDFYQQIETVLQEKGFAMEENFIDRWIREGRELGVQQGLQQGIQQTMRQAVEREAAFVTRLLQKRIGALSPDLQAEVRALPLEDLENLGEDLLDFNDLADLQAWLARHEASHDTGLIN